jgi:hypothetical protein
MIGEAVGEARGVDPMAVGEAVGEAPVWTRWRLRRRSARRRGGRGGGGSQWCAAHGPNGDGGVEAVEERARGWWRNDTISYV